MRAKITSDENDELNVGYLSPIWRERKPSDVFIVPSAETGEGLDVFLGMCEAGRNDNIRNLMRVDMLMKREMKEAQLAGILYTVMAAQKTNEDADTDWVQKLETLQKQQETLNKWPTLKAITELLVEKFEQCRKLCASLQEKQKEYGQAMTKHPKAIQILTVSMQCIDHVWKEIRGLIEKQKELSEELNTEKGYEFQVLDKDDEEYPDVRTVGSIQGLDLDGSGSNQNDVEVFNEHGMQMWGNVSKVFEQGKFTGIEDLLKPTKVTESREIVELSSGEETGDEDDVLADDLQGLTVKDTHTETETSSHLVSEEERDPKPNHPRVGEDKDVLERVRSVE